MLATTTYAALLKESRTEYINATVLDRKSRGSAVEGPAVLPIAADTVLLPGVRFRAVSFAPTHGLRTRRSRRSVLNPRKLFLPQSGPACPFCALRIDV